MGRLFVIALAALSATLGGGDGNPAVSAAGARSGTTVPAAEARRALNVKTGVVVDVTAVQVADGGQIGQNRATASAVGGLAGLAAGRGLKANRAGTLIAGLLGAAAADSAARRAGPAVRAGEEIVVRLSTGKDVAVVQEIEPNVPPLAIGESVFVVAGPATTRVVRQAAAQAAAGTPHQP